MILVPEDQLVSGRHVLARSLTSIYNYDPGFVMASMATHLMVQFDHSMPMIFDTNDVAAVIIDKNPEPKDLVIGVHVVAKRPKETSYVDGKVVETKMENGETLYLIDFWDGVEHWNSLDKIRILATSKPGGDYMRVEVEVLSQSNPFMHLLHQQINEFIHGLQLSDFILHFNNLLLK